MSKNQNQPIYILPEGTTRTLGREAQRNNIMAAKLVAETVRSTLGPKGMDKMIVDSVGDVIVTNDGVTILKEMQIEHPAAKMIVEVAKTQEKEVGDGTTTAVILAGELLRKAEELIDMNIHPTVVTRGYRVAAEKAQEILNRLADTLTKDDTETLKRAAETAMTGKGAEGNRDLLAEMVVRAVKQVADADGNVDLENIKIEKRVGGAGNDSSIIEGIILDKEKLHPNMPRVIKNAKIALLDSAIEVKQLETDRKIQITSPELMEKFLAQEEKMITDMVEHIKKSGANVVFCQKGIDDTAQYYLAQAGIYAARRIKKSDMERLSRATGGNVVTSLRDLKKSDLGNAGLVEEVKFGDDELTYVRECKNPKAITILLRGGTEHVMDELERAMQDALGDIVSALKNKKVVAGAGSIEVALSRELRAFSNKLSGREQLAVLAFADAMEVIPRTLAENAGLDPIDMLTQMKAEHDKGNKYAGIDVFTGKIMDAKKAGVIEPLAIKTQAVKSASEVAELILRIDDVIAGSGASRGAEMPPGGMGGMPMM